MPYPTSNRAKPAPGIAPQAELYFENQPLHQNLIVRVIAPFEALVMSGILIPILITAPASQRLPLILILVFAGVALPAMLFLIRLTTIVSDTELVIRYRPFPGRRIPIEQIRSAEAIRYNPIEAGGWGWRISRAYHRVFNVSGDRGVHVIFGDAHTDQFLVGSRNADALADAINLARASVRLA